MTTILITGAAGFVGSHLARFILEHTDWSVVCLDRIDEAGDLNRIAPLIGQHSQRFRVVWHDLRAAINPVMLRFAGDFKYVAHLAAASHVDRSIRDPMGFLYDNVIGTGHLLEYVRQHQPHCEKALVFSTDEVFGPSAEGETFDEYARFNCENPYAASKAGSEALAPAWAAQYHMPLTVTHCSNVYGPSQYQEKFIPLCAGKVERGELVQIHARGGKVSSRLYIHTDDVSRAVLTILQKGGIIQSASTGRYNIVSAQELSNLYVAEQIAALMGKVLNYELVENPPNRPKPDLRYSLAGERLAALGWSPQVPFEHGLPHALGLTEAVGKVAAE